MNRNVLLAAGAATAAFVVLVAAAAPMAPQGLVVPAGMVGFFEKPSCPHGWKDVSTNWHGRYVVITGTSYGKPVGTALAPGENRPTGDHRHTGAVSFYGGSCTADAKTKTKCVPSSGHGFSRGRRDTDGAQVLQGSKEETIKAGTNAPYVTLRACSKL